MNKNDLPFIVDLKDKVVVITGAGGVICSSLAQSISQCGAKVALLDLHLDSAQKYADEINANGGIAKAFEANVLKKDSLIKCHQEVLKEFGKCDILINGAGGNNPLATTDNEFAELDDNLKDMKTFFKLDDMIGREGCSILNIASMNAYTPLTKIPAYSGAKAAVKNFTSWLAVHFSHIGIRVNAIAPGFFVTKQNQALLYNNDGTPTARTNKILNATPMGRFGEVKELVGATLFLIDNKAASFITGICVPIDGGFSSYSGV